MKKIFLIMFLFSLCFHNTLFGQEQDTLLKIIKIGIKGYGGTMATNELNKLSDQWIEKAAETDNIETTSNGKLLLNKIEYGYTPFFFVHPIKLLQVGVKMDCSFATIRRTVENPIIKESGFVA